MREFLAVTKLAINDAFIYRSDMLLNAISLIIGPLIYLIIWIAISASGGTPPLNKEEFVQYYLLIILVRIWANGWNSQGIAQSIRNGTISIFLVKPMSYLGYRLGDSVGYKLIKGIFGLLAVVCLGLIFNVSVPEASPLQWFYFAASVLMSGLIVTLLDIEIGLLAFWLEDVTSIDEMNDILYMIFSGVIVPIVVFPQYIQQLLVYLPYKYMAAFPVEIILGQVSGVDLTKGMAIQFVWMLALFLLYKVLWSKGQTRYQSYGS